MGQSWQIKDKAARAKIGSVANEELDNIMTLIDDKLSSSLDVTISGTTLTIAAGTIQHLESNSADSTQNAYKWRLPLINGIEVNPAQSTLNLANGNVTGDMQAVTCPSVTANWYVKLILELRSDGKLYGIFGTPVASNPVAPIFTSGALQVALITLQANGTGGQWQFLTPAKSAIELIAAGGAGGGGTGGGGGASSNLTAPLIGEIPAGAVDGSNAAFAISYEPTVDPIVVIDGCLKYKTTHWTIATKTITFASAPSLGSNLLIIYGSKSALVQQGIADGDDATTKFRINKGVDGVGFLDGLVSIPGSEVRTYGNIMDFITAPASGQRVNMIGGNLGSIKQAPLAGTVDGSNTSFTIPATPDGDVFVFLNGLLVEKGAGAGKYTVSGTTVVFGTAPVVGQAPYVIY